MKASIRPDSHSKSFKEQVRRAVVDSHNKYGMDFDSIVLACLHKEFGFGVDRLRRFYFSVKPFVKELNEYYEMPNQDGWICRNELLKLGVDLEKWQEELLNEK